MFARFVALTTAAALLTACGSSQDDQIVMRDPSNGTERTYKEVRDMIADGTVSLEGETCSTFTSYGATEMGITFPAGEASFVRACEEGVKALKTN